MSPQPHFVTPTKGGVQNQKLFMRTTTFITLFVLHASLLTKLVAQNDTTNYYVETGGLAATSAQTPFWLRANQFGTVPLQNPFVFIKTGGQTKLGKNPRKPQLYLQGELFANLGKTSQLILPAAAATFRYRRFEAYVGRRKEFFGLGDTLLTSGSYAWSGNALPLPKIQVGTRGFVPLGFTKGLFAIHAMMAHGWFINADSVKNSYLHQKAVFVRLGKPTWKVHFYAGVHHVAQWGGQWRNPVPGSIFTLENGKLSSDLPTFLSVLAASEPTTAYATIYDALNRTGNQLGSIDFSITYKHSKGNWLFYLQHPYEDKSGVLFANFPDGLYGIRWKNVKTTNNIIFIKQLTLEYLTTMDQSGYDFEISNRRFNGADEYFINLQYQEGWTYQKRVIGTPFITRRWDTRPKWYTIEGGNVQITTNMISNNRVQLLHLGLMGILKPNINFRLLASQSLNFGRPMLTDPAFPLAQFSGILELSKTIKALRGVDIQAAVSVDRGPWLPNNTGLRIGIKKSGFVF